MSRWTPDARGRLEQAALDLYGERGFEQTTVAEIARRAGLTERTFFRYFADKREVLFGGGTQLQDLLVNAVSRAPRGLAALDAVAAALGAVGAQLQERRDFARQRQRIIMANAELRERELTKLASWSEALAEELTRRGLDAATARITGEVAVAVFRVAFERWIEVANEQDLPALVRQSFARLKAVTAS